MPSGEVLLLGARALRGGSWINTNENLRCSARNNNQPDNRNNNIGFRVVRPQSRPIDCAFSRCSILMLVFYGTRDYCSGMTCGSSSGVRLWQHQGKPEHNSNNVALVGQLNELRIQSRAG